MSKKIAEVIIRTLDGGSMIGYIGVKSNNDMTEKMNKMIKKGEIKLGCLSVLLDDVQDIDVKIDWVH